MRLEGIAKAGYFPTPPRITLDLIRRITPGASPAILDPCCGEGEALRTLREKLGGKSWGIELDSDRAANARRGNTHVRHGDALEHAGEGFNLLWLNSPYDDGDSERLEVTFLRHHLEALTEGGLLVFIIPERVLGACAPILRRRFERIGAYRFPRPEYDAFQQIVVIARRAQLQKPEGEIALDEWGAVPPLRLVEADAPHVTRHNVSESVMCDQASGSALWRSIWKQTEPPDLTIRPLMPLRTGHVALLLASGRLNGVVVEDGSERLLVRGSVEKQMIERLEGSKLIETERFVGAIRALNLRSGEIQTIE